MSNSISPSEAFVRGFKSALYYQHNNKNKSNPIAQVVDVPNKAPSASDKLRKEK